MYNFEDLNINKPLLNALHDLGYIHPTPIQEKSFSVIMSGQDMVGIAQTGTGKTFAYLLPILRMHKFSEKKYPKVLILVPTRELVTQVVSEIEKLAKYMSLKYAGIYGGTNINPQKKIVSAGLDILVSTPGRAVDLAMLGILRLKLVHHFVIDEVDEMTDQGFKAQLTTILDLLPPKRQNIFYSATFSENVSALTQTFTTNSQIIELAPHGTPLEKIKQFAYKSPNYFTKVNLLEHLLLKKKKFTKTLVFVDTIKLADRLYAQLAKTFNEDLALIHSGKSQTVRFATLANFHKGVNRILIATDIAARGLDILDVSHVINFDTPKVPGDYLHRIGRTGRAGKDGIAITFFNVIEENYLASIESLMKLSIARKRLPEEVEISTVFTDEERPDTGGMKNYLKKSKNKTVPASFHEKKAKNKKQNLGGPRKRNPNKTKPRNRAVERNRARKR